MAERLRR